MKEVLITGATRKAGSRFVPDIDAVVLVPSYYVARDLDIL